MLRRLARKQSLPITAAHPASQAATHRMGSVSSLSTTLPLPSVQGPPTSSISRPAPLPAGRQPPMSAAATWTAVPSARDGREATTAGKASRRRCSKAWLTANSHPHRAVPYNPLNLTPHQEE